MARIWLLDSETKGTGAHVAPLEKAHDQPREGAALAMHTFKRAVARRAAPVEAVQPRRFKVIDVMGARVLVEGIDLRATLALLERMGSALDVRIYVWAQGAGRWRLLTLGEHRALWRFRSARPRGSDVGAAAASAPSASST